MRETLSRLVILLSVGYCPFLMGQTSGQISADPPPDFSFAIARVFPHDTSAYTQGLAYRDGGPRPFLSDGTSEIRLLNADTFREKRRIKVHDGEAPVDQLNELEFVEGQIFANVWHSNPIARISPRTGDVVGWIDLTGLLSPIYRLEPEAVLNGIAYDSIRKRLFVTGKLWRSVFQIKLSPKHLR